MSPVAIGMDLFLAALLIAALVMGVRLNARLKALKQSHEGFARAIVDLNDAAVRAERGLAGLRDATTETHDSLLARIETARSLSGRLESQIQSARKIIETGELSRPAPQSAQDASAVNRPAESVMKLARRFGLSLDGDVAPTPAAVRAAATTRPAPRPAQPTRRRNAFEDELFEPQGAVPPPVAAEPPARSQPARSQSAPEPAETFRAYQPPRFDDRSEPALELSDLADLSEPARPDERLSSSVADDFAARIRARRSAH